MGKIFLTLDEFMQEGKFSSAIKIHLLEITQIKKFWQIFIRIRKKLSFNLKSGLPITKIVVLVCFLRILKFI